MVPPRPIRTQPPRAKTAEAALPGAKVCPPTDRRGVHIWSLTWGPYACKFHVFLSSWIPRLLEWVLMLIRAYACKRPYPHSGRMPADDPPPPQSGHMPADDPTPNQGPDMHPSPVCRGADLGSRESRLRCLGSRRLGPDGSGGNHTELGRGF
jgi:hypothetical protein